MALKTTQNKRFHAICFEFLQQSRLTIRKSFFNSQTNGFYDDKFSTSNKTGEYIHGEFLDHSVDLKKTRPGDLIQIPYEVTVGYGMRDFWHSSFYSHERINTSTPFARSLGFQDQVLPFSLMLFLASSMSHVDAAVVQVAYRSSYYLWPGFVGDTFTKNFRIKSLRSIKDGKQSAYDIVCELVNQRNRVCFTTEKTMIFPWPMMNSETVYKSDKVQQQELKEHIFNQSEKFEKLGAQSLKRLRKGQLILHGQCRPLTLTQSMILSSLGRLTHHRHFNAIKYGMDGLLVPGGLILGLSMSSSAIDLHEVLHEELLECSFINPFRPGEILGSISYIKNVEKHINGVLEKLTVRTVGIKGIDISELVGKGLPSELFTVQNLQTRNVEALCIRKFPLLCERIVSISERIIFRQAPKSDMFLL